jgi:hypothetical protein
MALSFFNIFIEKTVCKKSFIRDSSKKKFWIFSKKVNLASEKELT